MNKKIKTESVDALFQAVLSLQTKEECYSFFEDLCTASTATISRVNRSLNYGSDGYELVFERME